MDLTYQGQLRRAATAARLVLERAQLGGRRTDCLVVAVQALEGALANVVAEDYKAAADQAEAIDRLFQSRFLQLGCKCARFGRPLPCGDPGCIGCQESPDGSNCDRPRLAATFSAKELAQVAQPLPKRGK
jgi:hypothetical protein